MVSRHFIWRNKESISIGPRSIPRGILSHQQDRCFFVFLAPLWPPWDHVRTVNFLPMYIRWWFQRGFKATKWVKRTKDQISWVSLHDQENNQWIRSVALKVCDHQNYRKCILIVISSQLREQLEPFPVQKKERKTENQSKKSFVVQFCFTVLSHWAVKPCQWGSIRCKFNFYLSQVRVCSLHEVHMQFLKLNKIAVKREACAHEKITERGTLTHFLNIHLRGGARRLHASTGTCLLLQRPG